MKQKVYLSGAISGNPNYLHEFEKTGITLRDQGFEVINPCDNHAETYEEYLRIDLIQLLACRYICYVNDVTTSKGAFLERIVAEVVGLRK